MALGTDHINNADSGNFIPQQFSDGVVAAYKTNTVMRNLVTIIPSAGKKGDVINIPNPTRGSANAKVSETEVTLNSPAKNNIQINIDQHYEFSFLVEDITGVQGFDSVRQFYMDDAGHALATQVDTQLHSALELLQGGTDTGATETYAGAVIGGDGSTGYADAGSGNGSALSDVGIRRMIQTLDDADVPSMGRSLIIPPVTKNALLGLSRFTEQAFTGEIGKGNAIRTGYVGDVYGIPVYVSSNCETIESAGDSTSYRVGGMIHKSAIALAEQLAIRSQKQYKQEHLGTLYTSDTLFGVGELRNNAGVAFVVPS